MAFFAVRDDGGSNIGVATGDGGRYASITDTDDWATAFGATSGYYDSIASALAATTPPTASDIILVANDHVFTSGGSLAYGVVALAFAVSVDVSNVGQSSVGAKESTAAFNDIIFGSSTTGLVTHGIDFDIGDDVFMQESNCFFSVEKGSLNFDGSGDRLLMTGDGSFVKLIDSNISWPSGSTAQVMRISDGSLFEMTGGKIDGGSGTISDFIGDANSGINGGLTVKALGVNMEDITGLLLAGVGAAPTVDDLIDVRLEGCKLHASVTPVDEDFSHAYHTFRMTNCSSDADEAEYQDYTRTWAGDVQEMNASGIVRIDDVTFESGENTSLQITTVADCGIARPLVFELSGRYTKLSTAGEDTMIVYFAVVDTVTLTDTNFYAEVINPDGTTANLWDYSTNRNADILAAGTEWTDDSGSSVWEDNGVDLTGYNEYRMAITISGGGDGYPIIRMTLIEPSLAGTMYVSKDIGVS